MKALFLMIGILVMGCTSDSFDEHSISDVKLRAVKGQRILAFKIGPSTYWYCPGLKRVTKDNKEVLKIIRCKFDAKCKVDIPVQALNVTQMEAVLPNDIQGDISILLAEDKIIKAQE